MHGDTIFEACVHTRTNAFNPYGQLRHLYCSRLRQTASRCTVAVSETADEFVFLDLIDSNDVAQHSLLLTAIFCFISATFQKSGESKPSV